MRTRDADGAAVLAIWVDIDPADDALFNLWHSREHVQERVGLPGWLRGSRFRCLSAPGRYLLIYEGESGAVFESDAYYTRLRNPTQMSRAVLPKFRNTSRTVCAVHRRLGDGVAAAALTLRCAGDETPPFDAVAGLGPAKIDMLLGQPQVGQAHTAEKALRAAPDRQIERALVAYFWSVEAAEAARTRVAPAAEIFALQHTVSKGDLS